MISSFTHSGNCRLFGAVGDGIHDDTQIIQKILDDLPDGGTLFLPAGVYRLTAPLTIRSRINVIGEPAADRVGGAVIKAGCDLPYLLGAADVKIESCIFMSLTLDGGSVDGYTVGSLMDMPGFCSIKLANLRLQNCTGNGIHTYQGEKNDPTWISICENIEAVNVDGWAMEMINSDTAFNHISVSGGKGILDFNYGGNCYNDILVEHSTGSGFTIGREDRCENGHVSILHSTFRHNARYGLQLVSAAPAIKRVQVEACDFSDNAAGDVGIRNTRDDIFYNNNFRSAVAITDADTGANHTFTANCFAQASLDGPRYLIAEDNRFGVTAFEEKGSALDVPVYDYRRIYRAAALQCDSGRAVNLHDYPADGDDYAPAFTAAVEALGTAGGIIYVPRGSYGIGSTVAVPAHVYIVGEGANSTVEYYPLCDIDVMFAIENGADDVVFMHGNVVNPQRHRVGCFIRGEALTDCLFDSVHGNSNVVDGYDKVICLVRSRRCVVNSMICGIGDGGTMTYFKDCTDCCVQSGYISRGGYGTVVDGGSRIALYNNHYDWFYHSAVLFKNGAKDCVFRSNYCDINQHVVSFDYDEITRANITVSTSISRESGVPARSPLKKDAPERRQIPEILLRNAEDVRIIGFSSDVWLPSDDFHMLELHGKNEDITVVGCICGDLFEDVSAFGNRSRQYNNLVLGEQDAFDSTRD